MFELNGMTYTYESRLVDTWYGPETLVKIYNEEGTLVHSAQEPMAADDIIYDFCQDHRENEDA